MEKRRYETYIFDLYGTLVDIHTEEDAEEVWKKLALFYGYYDALYEPKELQQAFRSLIAGREAEMRKELQSAQGREAEVRKEMQSPQGREAKMRKELQSAQGREMEMQSAQGREADAHEAFPEVEIEQIFLELFQRKGVEADLTLAVHAGQFFRILTTEYIRLYDGAKELLAALKEAGGKLYLLSNAQRIFTEYELHTLGIASYFEDIFISSSCGVKKPDERFFRMLLDKHHIDVSKAIMIGNDMNSDICGAKQVGLSAFYIHSNISPELEGKPEADEVLLHMDMKAVRERLLG